MSTFWVYFSIKAWSLMADDNCTAAEDVKAA